MNSSGTENIKSNYTEKKSNRKTGKKILISVISVILVLVVATGCVFYFLPVKYKAFIAVENTFNNNKTFSFRLSSNNGSVYNGKIVPGNDFNSSLGNILINSGSNSCNICYCEGKVFAKSGDLFSVMIDVEEYNKNQESLQNNKNPEKKKSFFEAIASDNEILEKINEILDYTVDINSFPTSQQIVSAAEEFFSKRLSDDVFDVQSMKYQNGIIIYNVDVDTDKFYNQLSDFLKTSDDLKGYMSTKTGEKIISAVDNADREKNVVFEIGINNAAYPVVSYFDYFENDSKLFRLEIFDINKTKYTKESFEKTSSDKGRIHKEIDSPDDVSLFDLF